ncbi:MAG: hypothetical protein ABIG42_08895 [bacterium]
MNDHRLNATGLDEAEISEPKDGSNEWDRDTLLIDVEVKFASLKRGSSGFYIRYILPLAIAFITSGGILTFTLAKIHDGAPLWLTIISEVFLIVGIFALIAVVIILVLDNFRLKEIKSITNDDLSAIGCEFFFVKLKDSDQIPSCRYFNRDLIDNPLCLICPVCLKIDE